MLSKRSTMIALTLLAALSVEIGCGDGSHRASVRKSLTTVTPDSKTKTKTDPNAMISRQAWNDDGTPKFDANGKPVMEKVRAADADKHLDKNGKPIMPAIRTTKTDGNLDKVAQLEKSLSTSGTLIPREKLDPGTYTLQTTETIAKITGGSVGEDTKAYLRSQLADLGNGQYRLDSDTSSAISAGFITSYNETPRDIDIPASFKVEAGGAANRTAAANLTFTDLIETATGKAVLKDGLKDTQMLNSGFWNLLANGSAQSDGSYRFDDNGKPIYLRLLKQQDKLVVFMSFEEQRDTGGASKTTADREVFFTYKFTPDSGKAADAGTKQQDGGQAASPSADDQIHVSDIGTQDAGGAAGADQGTK